MSQNAVIALLVCLFCVGVFCIAVVIATATDLGNDFHKRCEAAGGKPVVIRSEQVCMRKDLFVEVSP